METVERLENWYEAQCDGRWEHQWGIRISTLDNPGWSVRIHLNGTAKADAIFEPVNSEQSDTNWIRCWKEDTIFEGRGDPRKLKTILEHFFRFINE
jgi:hypothetical protein